MTLRCRGYGRMQHAVFVNTLGTSQNHLALQTKVLNNIFKTSTSDTPFKMPSMHGWKIDNAAESFSKVAALITSFRFQAFTNISICLFVFVVMLPF
jgi:hypothetical protein